MKKTLIIRTRKNKNGYRGVITHTYNKEKYSRAKLFGETRDLLISKALSICSEGFELQVK